jgi:hypothetical protein
VAVANTKSTLFILVIEEREWSSNPGLLFLTDIETESVFSLSIEWKSENGEGKYLMTEKANEMTKRVSDNRSQNFYTGNSNSTTKCYPELLKYSSHSHNLIPYESFCQYPTRLLDHP